MFSKFSRRQIIILAAFGVADFFNACCVSLQAPFFPIEAEGKGATASEYGIVFGIFEFVVFLVSPFYGRNVGKIGPRRMFFGGILTSGICSILFGLLDLINEHYLFISSALLIRIIEALGNAAFLTASFSIIANEFPKNVATTFASLETFFGMGMIAGPTLGGLLYQTGGYPTPFIVLGAALFLTAVLVTYVLPVHNYQTTLKSNYELSTIFKIKGLPLSAATIMSTSTSIMFCSAILEPHVRQFGLSPFFLGVVFVVLGATYGASAPVWGLICDKLIRPKAVSAIGGVILIIGISFIGPAPFWPFSTIQKSIYVVMFGLVLVGLGVGARLVSSFADALHSALAYGLPNDLHTYGLVSGLWTSSFALGAFIGPSVSGVLYDSYKFPYASLFLITFVTIMVFIEFVNLLMAGHQSYMNSMKRKFSITTEAILASTTPSSDQTILEKLYHGSYQNNVGMGSTRTLNLVYNSEHDLSAVEKYDETSALIAGNHS